MVAGSEEEDDEDEDKEEEDEEEMRLTLNLTNLTWQVGNSIYLHYITIISRNINAFFSPRNANLQTNTGSQYRYVCW